ncbi:BldC family transcriptional regulator [Actinocatenispora thailandica]|nr:BldC family transcriptional regulator [Actinocatenispora thailandica]
MDSGEYVQRGVVESSDRLLTPGEVASLFRVDPKTVTRWAAAGRIGSIRTPGGHRRFRESEVRALLSGDEAGFPEESQATSH